MYACIILNYCLFYTAPYIYYIILSVLYCSYTLYHTIFTIPLLYIRYSQILYILLLIEIKYTNDNTKISLKLCMIYGSCMITVSSITMILRYWAKKHSDNAVNLRNIVGNIILQSKFLILNSEYL